MNKKDAIKLINKGIDFYEKCKELNIATSVIDIRQPFFVDSPSKVLTVKEKLGL